MAARCRWMVRGVDPVPRRLILASASPRRRELLSQLGYPFDVQVAAVVENEDPATDPREMVSHNAALKSRWVSDRVPEAVVLGADTTVFLDGHALNKPGSPLEALAMLRRLSGRTHQVFTGVSVNCLEMNLHLNAGAVSEVTFRVLDDRTIDTYLSKVHVFDKAGGYAIQEHGDLIVASFSGELSTIVGLPLSLTKQLLTRAGLLA